MKSKRQQVIPYEDEVSIEVAEVLYVHPTFYNLLCSYFSSKFNSKKPS